MEYQTLLTLRKNHPAWRLLLADHGAFLASFLHRTFIAGNVRTLSVQDLEAKLDDYLFQLREKEGPDHYPRKAGDYLDDWAAEGRGFLRKYYPPGTDEPHVDLTPATEMALAWLSSLGKQRFVGTESRLLTVFELLRQMVEGTRTDPAIRIAELEKRKAAIELELERARKGEFDVMDPAQVRDRFLQMSTTAHGLLSDFRLLEQSFRELDRSVRERIATFSGGKGMLLDEIFGQRDAISDSDQGRSFRAFWDFLMSPSRQEELTQLLQEVLALPAVARLEPDARLARVHYDWLEAGEVAQRTVARLSEQLRRYLDNKAWLENRFIMQVIQGIERTALAIRAAPPADPFMTIDESCPAIELPMERPLFSPPWKPIIGDLELQTGDGNIATDVLYEQVYVDKPHLAARIRRALQSQSQISLAEIIRIHPVEQGLAEIVAYLSLAAEDSRSLIEDERTQTLSWTDATGTTRQATVPTIIFCR